MIKLTMVTFSYNWENKSRTSLSQVPAYNNLRKKIADLPDAGRVKKYFVFLS